MQLNFKILDWKMLFNEEWRVEIVDFSFLNSRKHFVRTLLIEPNQDTGRLLYRWSPEYFNV